jgi:hypothetical protein
LEQAFKHLRASVGTGKDSSKSTSRATAVAQQFKQQASYSNGQGQRLLRLVMSHGAFNVTMQRHSSTASQVTSKLCFEEGAQRLKQAMSIRAIFSMVEIRVAASDFVQCHCNIGKRAAELQLKPPCQTVL